MRIHLGKQYVDEGNEIGVEDIREDQEVKYNEAKVSGSSRNGQSWSRLMILDWISPRITRFRPKIDRGCGA